MDRASGALLEFEDKSRFIDAVKRLSTRYSNAEAFTPYPIDEVTEELGFTAGKLPLLILLGGISGGLTAFIVQWYSAVHFYPINVGGRPLFSWPSFIPLTFELTILFAAISGFVGFFVLCGLPRPHHPVFEVERFSFAREDRFFLFLPGVKTTEIENVRVVLGEAAFSQFYEIQ